MVCSNSVRVHYIMCACVYVMIHTYINITIYTGFVSWTQECGCSTLQHESCTVNFTELSKALMILHGVRSEWSDDDIISIIDEMTSKYCWHSY